MNASHPHQIFSISGMHCANCVSKVNAAVEGLGGVLSVHTTLKPPQVHVEAKRRLPIEEMRYALKQIGQYDATEQVLAEPSASGDLDPNASLYPLYLIVAYLVLVVATIAAVTGQWAAHALMAHFMAGFFLVFSFFKFLDLRGFASTYRTYDPIAAALPSWGLAYPFVELALGIAYLTRFQPQLTNLITLALMSVGAFGVWRALKDKKRLRCACLGTALNLPMTTVTLVEDVGMAVMALLMLTIG